MVALSDLFHRRAKRASHMHRHRAVARPASRRQTDRNRSRRISDHRQSRLRRLRLNGCAIWSQPSRKAAMRARAQARSITSNIKKLTRFDRVGYHEMVIDYPRLSADGYYASTSTDPLRATLRSPSGRAVEDYAKCMRSPSMSLILMPSESASCRIIYRSTPPTPSNGPSRPPNLVVSCGGGGSTTPPSTSVGSSILRGQRLDRRTNDPNPSLQKLADGSGNARHMRTHQVVAHNGKGPRQNGPGIPNASRAPSIAAACCRPSAMRLLIPRQVSPISAKALPSIVNRPFNCGLLSSYHSFSPVTRRQRFLRRSWSGLRRRSERGWQDDLIDVVGGFSVVDVAAGVMVLSEVASAS